MTRPRKILLVDDDDGTRITLGFALRQAGLDVRTAASAPEALRLLDEERFDWLVTDGEMRPDDGRELACRAVAAHPGLRVAMISGIYLTADLECCPVLRVFTKPVDPGELRAFLV